MAGAVEVENARPVVEDDRADSVAGNGRERYDPDMASDPDVVVYRISGAFFFGAAAGVGAALDRIGERPKAYVIDLSAVPMLDSTGAATIEAFARKAHRQGAAVYISGASRTIRRMLLIHGVKPPHVRFRKQLADAVRAAHRVGHPAPPAAPLPVT
jgi:SulP family sulfate permease